MEFRITNDGNKSDITQIQSRLEAYNAAHGAATEKDYLGIFYEDENGQKLAGLIGYTFGLWLSVEFLFVDDSLRGQGIGKKLLTLAEETAKARGCKHATLNTNAFQAPEFYKKQGYTLAFTLREFPVDGEKYYFVKDL